MAGDLTRTIEEYQKKGTGLKIIRKIKTGKEAEIYLAAVDGKSYALKVYKNPDFRSFQDNLDYTVGKYYRKPSIRKAVRKRTKFGKRFLHKAWVRREAYLLNELKEMGANVPEVVDHTSNSILMELIGEGGDLAPRLIDIDLPKPEAQKAFETVLKHIKLFLECGIIHGDLSAYNILWWNNQPYIIDLPQALDIRSNPNKERVLRRDIDNVIGYFKKYFDISSEKVCRRFGIPD